jgi:tetratricopeptide (TPR) repeat protein
VNVVELHPEQLFDALRAGKLSAAERTRLEAHCARCTACLFELRWVEGSALSQLPSADDRAYADAALDTLLRAKSTAPVSAAKARLGWKLPLGIGGLMLAIGAGIGSLSTPWGWGGGQADPPRPAPALTISPRDLVEAHSPPVGPVTQVASERDQDSNKDNASSKFPSANQLLAAARRAQSRGQLARADRLYRQVISAYASTPEGGAAQVALGRLLFDDEQLFAALTQFRGYLVRRPNGPLAEDALFYRALAFEKLGNGRLASASFRELLRQFPQSLYADPARARLAASKSEQ